MLVLFPVTKCSELYTVEESIFKSNRKGHLSALARIYPTSVELINMARFYLGELEELVLLIVALLRDEAYGVTVVTELQKQAGREVSISAVHAVLHRLEEKGFVESHMGGSSSERGGRRKRLFKMTAYGLQVIEQLRDTRNAIWDIISNPSAS